MGVGVGGGTVGSGGVVGSYWDSPGKKRNFRKVVLPDRDLDGISRTQLVPVLPDVT